MPKIVDHEARRAQIVEAVWDVVGREGVSALSVRSVAAAGGWSTGSLRHYFASQSDLTVFAMRAVMDRIRDRGQAMSPVADIDGILELLAVALPVDDDSRAETEVWLALSVAARTDRRLAALARQGFDELRAMVRSCVEGIGAIADVELDIESETDRLVALVDGLAMQASLYPDALPADRQRAALRAHVDGLIRRSSSV
ncbi:TetR/AcrR family transcriptional regulator [Luteipulveratus halotolerans]|uniref:HTH tetR-type domain-containing protein n=1 Tax=Luteipulveratus halotolerans TaxID=1631356 RepID=A0A0L6CHF4_9MICO|nr:TetR family transcriptional regulator C-terminal domain-containing protein [Luteipulveratus halotolerans]KNX37246.1 hypothetical protein VV01_08955 [Luteipulveratus halotolerans]